MKVIMELFQGDAVKFFGINKKIVSATRTELTHLELKRNIDDWVLEAEDKSFIHFEFQTTLNENDLKRFMVSDAILCYKKGRPVKTVIVYTGNIEKAKTALDFDSIRYNVDAFYLSFQGNKRHIRTNADSGHDIHIGRKICYRQGKAQ
jgi:hypothetical protein